MNCKYCGAELETDSKFCVKCGKSIIDESLTERMCPKCGESMEADAKFCIKCGYSESKKKKPRVTWIIVVMVVLLIGVVGIMIYMQQKAAKEAEMQRQAEIHTFQEKSIEIYDAINEAKGNFNLMSTMYSTSTEMNVGLFGPSFYTSYVTGLCSAEITEEKTRKREIDTIYTDWKNLSCEEEEIKELKKVVEDFYYAYVDRYELLVEADFSTYTFATEEKASSNDFNNKKSAVEAEINMIDGLDLNEDDTKEGGTSL